MSRFILIAYKPRSEDYCKGCLMASYDSDHAVHSVLTEEEFVRVWSEYLLRNMNLDINEHGYTFWVFKDGIQVIADSSYYWDGDDDGTVHEQLVEDLHKRAEIIAQEKRDKINKEKKEAEEAAKLKRDAADKLRRAAEYEKLKKEFEQVGA